MVRADTARQSDFGYGGGGCHYPEAWIAEAAVLGGGDGFNPAVVRDVSHRQGRALETKLPLDAGWSVLRGQVSPVTARYACLLDTRGRAA